MFGLGKHECPTGTVPILRTTKDDLIREKSLLNDHILLQDLPGVHVAEVSVKPNYGPYYGVGGLNSIFNPRVDTNLQISMSHLWVQNGPIESTNKISLGWHVSPQLYNDHATHFYISWTSDNYKKTGCYNIRCAGFVQTSKEIFIGRAIGTISQYGGRLCVLAFSITQDPVTKNWWISIDNKPIGYFPAKLFSNMSSANEVGWGGRTRTHPGTQSPQMGSGHFPHDDNPTHACYYKQISIQDNERKTHGVKVYEANSFTDKPNCYDVRYYGYKGPHFGDILMFGGPGGNCGN
ncbi:uncharacterized protein LOC128196614 [Vigna angularis]|uniref:uncharacterized protein LOC128196614 n=1 Tax=Phaseolus angularis TaxID=3914 RepID=UPI0022B57A1E|nr:uncharacterized protein LOC128196614 [Vigna angularis]